MILRILLLCTFCLLSVTKTGYNNIVYVKVRNNIKKQITREDSLIKELSIFLTEEQVKNWITVAKLESGIKLDSKGVCEYNNYFGLSYNRTLIKFNSLKECVSFLKTLLYNYPKLLSTNYYIFAKELINFGWAEDPSYYNKYIYLRIYLYEQRQQTPEL